MNLCMRLKCPLDHQHSTLDTSYCTIYTGKKSEPNSQSHSFIHSANEHIGGIRVAFCSVFVILHVILYLSLIIFVTCSLTTIFFLSQTLSKFTFYRIHTMDVFAAYINGCVTVCYRIVCNTLKAKHV